MLVYGDAARSEDAFVVLDELAHMASSSGGSSKPWILRHAQLVGLFIRAGELVQGLADADFAAADADGWDAAARRRAEALRLLAELVLRSWTGRSDVRTEQLARALRMLRAECPAGDVRIKQPEGYGCYAVYPEAYGLAASPLAAAAPVVIGLRSIGTSLGAMVAARTRSTLFVTLRPSGDPFHRALRLAPDLSAALRERRGRAFAVVDEGPGLSGSSMAGTAAALEELGVSPQHIHFLPSHSGLPGSAASEEVSARWHATQRHVVTFDDMALGKDGRELASWVADLTGPPLCPLQDIGGGRWREFHDFHERPPGGGMRERRKLLLTSDRGTFLLRFVGLGAAGEAALRRARALSDAGFVPPVLGLRHGFLVERWLGDARPLDVAGPDPSELVMRLADYLAFRARHLPAAPHEGASLPELATMAARNGEILLGRSMACGALARAAERLDPRVRRVQTDNRLHWWEWLRRADGRLVKTDAVDHCAGHELVGCQDIAWDVMGAIVELALDHASQATLLARLAAGGVSIDHEVLRFYEPCYAAFQAGSFYLDAAAEQKYHDKKILEVHASRYLRILERFHFSKNSLEPSL